MSYCVAEQAVDYAESRMEKMQSRFGEIEYDPSNTLLFPNGLIGFEDMRQFVVLPNEKEGPLFWIQSVEDPQLAFVLTDPTNFYHDYKVVPDGRERQMLGIDEKDECHAVSVVTVPPSRKVTLNLAAPILFAPKTNRAMQVILEGTRFDPRTPLPEVNEEKGE